MSELQKPGRNQGSGASTKGASTEAAAVPLAAATAVGIKYRSAIAAPLRKAWGWASPVVSKILVPLEVGFVGYTAYQSYSHHKPAEATVKTLGVSGLLFGVTKYLPSGSTLARVGTRMGSGLMLPVTMLVEEAYRDANDSFKLTGGGRLDVEPGVLAGLRRGSIDAALPEIVIASLPVKSEDKFIQILCTSRDKLIEAENKAFTGHGSKRQRVEGIFGEHQLYDDYWKRQKELTDLVTKFAVHEGGKERVEALVDGAKDKTSHPTHQRRLTIVHDFYAYRDVDVRTERANHPEKPPAKPIVPTATSKEAHTGALRGRPENTLVAPMLQSGVAGGVQDDRAKINPPTSAQVLGEARQAPKPP